MWRPVLHKPKLGSYWEIEEKWDINDLFDAHEIMDVIAKVSEDEKKKIDREMKRNRK